MNSGLRHYGSALALAAIVLSAAACGQKPAEPAPAVAPAPAPPVEAPAPPAAAASMVWADFASADRKNALGAEFGAWASGEPQSVSSDEIIMGAGSNGSGAWKLNYDISTPGSYCGLWMKLNGFDASSYKNYVITLKGEGTFSPDIIVELKSGEGAAQQVGRYTIRGITNEYKTFTIPLTAFSGLNTRSGLSEATVVLDPQVAPSVKKGSYLIDSIGLE